MLILFFYGQKHNDDATIKLICELICKKKKATFSINLPAIAANLEKIAFASTSENYGLTQMSGKRTSRKSESNKALRKMISIEMADKAGTTRNSIVTEDLEMLWQLHKNNENKDF